MTHPHSENHCTCVGRHGRGTGGHDDRPLRGHGSESHRHAGGWPDAESGRGSCCVCAGVNSPRNGRAFSSVNLPRNGRAFSSVKVEKQMNAGVYLVDDEGVYSWRGDLWSRI